ncbi:ABC transporter ATP-binding protein [Pseudoroseicyclus aestuarii]|uniref:Peptide/nickel transport system ATP-binding protein n=1 Tax=Pseudoroseicyclus aestuarii TaxID=1795041 RepID=A0A318ST47_9RHOB|nr:oligopeptide/dipeptide ABC transporter ATP-binding protein [Pseudoroseicyclus aestuarii]PYE82482.1 peptide/nickel transport system ATP-binding protein [Pseudoroseicyclus aestuarii]
MSQPLVDVRDLSVHFPVGRTMFNQGVTVRAVDGVSLSIGKGEVLGLVGESGSGKTTLGRSLLRLVEPTGGSVRLNGEEVTTMSPARLRRARSEMQIIFQDPFASLNPRMSVGEILSEALHLHRIGTRADRRDRVATLLEKVGLPASAAQRHPHEFSGGQRQRIGIARALSVNPAFIVADEPVSALDVSIQAQIVNLLHDLREALDLSILFIGHDLSVIEYLCDRVMVMYMGRVMETGTVADIYQRPRHPYTRALLDAAPQVTTRRRTDRIMLTGDLPSPVNPPSGCIFRTRCPFATEACAQAIPPLLARAPGHEVACIRAEEIDLAPA